MTTEAALSSVDVLLRALDALEAACWATSKDEAVRRTQEVLAGLDSVSAVRVAACLAVESAWSLRPPPGWDLGRWVERIRLEATWQTS